MPTGLIRRGARYSTRRRIPLDLIEHYGGRAELVRALGSSDPAEAKRLHALMWVALDQEFDAARAAIAPKDNPPAKPVDVAGLAARALQSLRQRRDEAAKAGELEGFVEYQQDQLAYQQAVLDGVEATERPLAVHEAHRNAVQALLSGDGAMGLGAVAQPLAEAGDSPRVSELLTQWLKYQDRPPSTVKEMQRAIDRFIQVMGDKRVNAVARRDVTAFSDKLREPGAISPEGVSINELCQLHPGDVQQEGYTDAKGKPQKAWVIRIEHDVAKGKRVKTEGSERRVPVHPDLVKVGFVKYAQVQAGKPLLFDRLSMGPKETRLAGNWGRWFAR